MAEPMKLANNLLSIIFYVCSMFTTFHGDRQGGLLLFIAGLIFSLKADIAGKAK